MILDYGDPVATRLSQSLTADRELEVLILESTGQSFTDDLEQQTPGFSPDVVLANSSIREMNGPEIVAFVFGGLPGVAVLIISTNEDSPDFIESLQAGASGYLLLKGLSDERLRHAVKSVQKGQSAIRAEMLRVSLIGLISEN